MNPSDPDKSLGDDGTLAGATKRRPLSEVSLGDERTLGDGRSGQDTVIDDIEVVDLDARYRTEGTLGQGGMGAVLLATDTRLERKVAIKRILGEAAGNRMAVQRFLTEAKAIAALNHQNIVQIYDYGRAKDGPFLIMEYVDGGSLLDRCRESALLLEEAIDLACQLCDGLAKAHDLGIIHRDIKPANILLSKDGIPKLTDFGLAKAQAVDHGHTMTGALLGTPDFMPPEQRRDASEVDARSDLWSLAATVYQMVTGRSPKVIRFRDVPSELENVLTKALEDRKDDRYQTARELRDALKAVQQAASDVKPSPATTEGDLQEGLCSSCGTVSTDLSRKFCRNPACGASLRTACLNCDSQIPVWDLVCGECGGNQPRLLAELRESLKAKRSTAEALLADLSFDEAAALAAEVATAALPHLNDFAEWGRSFGTQVAEERVRQEKVVAERIHEAKAHQEAFDYPAAIHALETIPERLRIGDVSYLLDTCGKHHSESVRVIEEITNRIRRKEYEGLLPLVTRACELRGDRKDIAKIKSQLVERRDGRVARARAALQAGDTRAALAAVKGLADGDLDDAGQEFVGRARQIGEIEGRLVALVKDAKQDGVISAEEALTILDVGEEYLAIHPSQEQVQSIVKQARGIVEPLRLARELERKQKNILAQPLLFNVLGMELKLLPAGTFTMGDRRDAHEVTLTRAFYIGVTAVTNAEWRRVMGSVPSAWKDDDHPVEQVSWKEAMDFCQKLSALPEERKAGRVYRLPTEAEWEYACRAGTNTLYSFGDDESRLGEYGWFNGNSDRQTHPVGEKKANPWGLYDMHGNVWEWCSDGYGEYPRGVVTDPQGPSEASGRVSRGGSWINTAENCRSAYRYEDDPSRRGNYLGFRLALSPSGAEPLEAGE